MRCFDVLGEKVVGQLLLKKRFQEDAENRMLITIVLWNLLYVWPDYLAHILLMPDGAIPGYGQPIATVPRSLLEDFWEVPSRTQAQFISVGSSRSQGSDKFSPSLRSLSILSGARTILAKRLPSMELNVSVVSEKLHPCTIDDFLMFDLLKSNWQLRELVVSFMLRSTVASTIKNTIADSRQCIAGSSNGRKKAKKSGVHVGTPLSPLALSGASYEAPEKVDRKIERKEFKLSTLTADDAEDLGGDR
jgi:hypothetical protein